MPVWTSARIKRLRKRFGESQEVFARVRLGVVPATLRDWEQGRILQTTGRPAVPNDTAQKLLDCLKRDLDAGRLQPSPPSRKKSRPREAVPA